MRLAACIRAVPNVCAKIRLILRDPRVLTAAGAIGVFAAVIASAISDLVYLQGAGASWLWFMLVDAPGRVFQNNVAAAVAALRTTIWFSDLGTPFPTGRLISICVGLPAAAALALAIATNVNWNDVYDRWEHVRSEVFGDAWDLYSQYLPAGCASWLQAYAHPPERAAGAAGRQTHVVLLSAIWWHALLPRLIDEHLLLITTLVARKAFTTSIPPPPIALDRTWGWFTEACQTSACVAFYFVLGVIVPWDFRLRAMLSRSGVRWWHNAVAATLEWTVTGFAYVLPALAAEGVEFIPAIFLLPLVAAAACALGSVLLVALPIASGRIVRYVDGLFQVGPDWRSLWHRVFAQPAGGAQREVAAIDAADPVQLFMKGPLQAILAGAAEFALACIVELYASKAGQAMAAALIAGTGRADLARYSISGWISVGGEYVTAAVAVVAVVVGIVVSLLTSLRIYAALRALRTLSRVRDIHWLGSPELQWGAVTRTEGHGDNGVETKTTRILTAWDAALQMKDLLGQFQSRDPSDLIDDLGRIVATLRRFLGNHSGGQDKWHESTAVVAVPVAPASDSVRVPGLTFVVQLHRRRPLFLGMSSGELEVEAFAVDARFLCEYHDLSAEDVAEIVVDPFSVPNIAELPVDTQTEDGRVILCISVRIRVRSGPLSR